MVRLLLLYAIGSGKRKAIAKAKANDKVAKRRGSYLNMRQSFLVSIQFGVLGQALCDHKLFKRDLVLVDLLRHEPKVCVDVGDHFMP